MSRPIDALDREWQTYDRRPAVRRFMASVADHPLLDAPTAAILVQRIRLTGHTDPARADLMLAELIGDARHDRVAQRIVLQALVPGLCNVIGRLAQGEHPSRRREVPAEVLSLAGLRIASYPLDRRLRAIACNVLRDVERDYRTERRRRLDRARGVDVEHDRDPSALARDGDPFGQVDDRLDLVDIFERARAAAVLTARDVEFLVETRVPDRAADEVACDRNISADTLRRARLRAEARLGRFCRDGLAA